MGKTIVAGRKTAESFGWSESNAHSEGVSQPLPGRELIVLGRGGHDTYELEEVLKLDKPLCFVGGGEIYEQVLPHVHRAVVTHLETLIHHADTKFNTGYLLKRFDKWLTVKQWGKPGKTGGRIVIYEHIRRS